MTVAAGGSVRRLRPAVHVAPITDGLLFRGWDASVVVRGGEAIARLWAAVEPRLVAGVDTTALTGALPAPAAEALELLLTRLDEAEMLVAGRAGQTIDAGRFVRTAAYLESVAADPPSAFMRVRRATVAVRGGGPGAHAATRTLLRFGIGTVIVDSIDDRLRREAGRAGATLRERTPGGPASLGVIVAETALAVTPSGTWLPVVLSGGAAVVGPVHGVGGAATSVDAVARVAARSPEVFDGRPSPVIATLAGNLAALEAFRVAAGLELELVDSCAVARRDRLTSSVHPVVALHGSPGAAPVQAQGIDPIEFEVLTEELLDEITGAVPAPELGELPQVPLALARDGSPGAPRIVAWGRDGEEARRRALAALVLDDARPADGHAGVGRSVVQAMRDLTERAVGRTWLRSGTVAALRPARDPAAVRDSASEQRWWRRLTADGREPDLVHATGVGHHLVAVVRAGRPLAVTLGKGLAGTVERCLQHALAADTLAEHGVTLGPLPLPRCVLERDLHTEEEVRHDLDHLLGGPQHAVVCPVDPAVARAGLVVVRATRAVAP